MVLIQVSFGLPLVAFRALATSWDRCRLWARDDHLCGWSIVLLLGSWLLTVDLSHGIWPRPRLGLRTVGLAHGIWTKPRLARAGTVGLGHGIWPKPRLARAEPDELPVPDEGVAFVSSNLVSSSGDFLAD